MLRKGVLVAVAAETAREDVKMKYFCMFFLGLLMSGCRPSSTNKASVSWRTDPQPITSRFRVVDGASAFVWKGELVDKHSRLSVPGPSAYRVRCFVEGFSNAFSNATELLDFQPTVLPSDISFPKHLLTIPGSEWYISTTIDKALFTLKYQGKAFYAPSHDLLYFDAFWQ